MPSKLFPWWTNRNVPDPKKNGDSDNAPNINIQVSVTPTSRHASSTNSEDRPRPNGCGSFWSDVVRELHFIDESARTSLASETVDSHGRKLSAPSRDFSLRSPAADSRSRAGLSVDFCDSKGTSLQTLAVNGVGETPVFDEEDHPPLYTNSYPELPPTPLSGVFKPCLVELDAKGNAHTQSIKQLSFGDSGVITESKSSKDGGVGFMCPIPYDLEKDFRYFFQHPYSRLFITYFVIFCNFLIFAEDPVSHSHMESEIPVMGNVFSFVFTKYPPEWYWKFIKVVFWLVAILIGLICGKQVIHKLIFGRLFRLKMFYDEQGSWMIMFLTVVMSLYIFSYMYNTCLMLGHTNYCTYQITALMGITNSSFMKACACGTWLGDFVTAWMVTDMMLQDNLYPTWAPSIRTFWRTGNTRIMTFWLGSIGMTVLVVTLIVTDLVNWDLLNRDFVATTELSRAFLASFILVMDLLIVMQDWDFPHFTSTLDINLPGMKIKHLRVNFCKCVSLKPYWRIHVTGKWFNYGIILMVMILDLNMWKNQIFYVPQDYGQYIGPDFKIYTVSEQEILLTGNKTLWTYDWRAFEYDPETNLTLLESDMKMNSRYLAYTLEEKCGAFIPSIIGFIGFLALIIAHGRFPHAVQSLKKRIQERKKQYRSSWKRDRGSLHRSPRSPDVAEEMGLPMEDMMHSARASLGSIRKLPETQL